MAVLLLGILHFLGEDAEVAGILRTLRQAMAAGSYLAVCQLAADIYPEMTQLARRVNERQPHAPLILRDRAQVTGLFNGLELVPPGVVQVSKWRPHSDLEAAAPAALWGGVAQRLRQGTRP